MPPPINPPPSLDVALQNLPSGFMVEEYPGDYYTDRGRISLRSAYASFDGQEVTAGKALYSTRIKALKDWADENSILLSCFHAVSKEIVINRLPTNAVRTVSVQDSIISFRTTMTNSGDAWQVVPTPEVDLGSVGFQPDGVLATRPADTTVVRTAPVPVQWVFSRSVRALEHRRSQYFFASPADRVFDPQPFTCPVCNEEHPYGTLVCGSFALSCCSCGNMGVKSVPSRPNGLSTVCTHCGNECREPGCSHLVQDPLRYCDSHAQHSTCIGCGDLLEWAAAESLESVGIVPIQGGRYACLDCSERVCSSCGNYAEDELDWSSVHQAYVCRSCRRDILTQSNEDFDESASHTFDQMPVIEGRETIRFCGIEIEGANGTTTGDTLARDFASLGLSMSQRITDHHAGDRYGFAHVEYDSTVDWEAVFGPVNMADAEHVRWVNSLTKAIRDRVRRGELKLDLRCGLHIHVSAEKISLTHAYNLSHLFTYLEDPLFRIAAAKWPYHRAAQGSRYCAPIPKYNRRLDFYNNYGGRGRGTRENHYYALSFGNYFNSMIRNCGCGAVAAGCWDECACPNLPKCTFEFRLFNTTANPKKLFAYMALCQALVAKAVSLGEVKNPLQVFPACEFNRRVFNEMDETDAGALAEAWAPRLDYIFNELPLTEEEKEAVRYCVRNCEIAAGMSEDTLETLMLTQAEEVAI